MHGRTAESSQRSRGLLFLAAGIATAWALRQDQLRVFENGIGAINLPYLRSQFGSQATRAMHPRTLLLAQNLAAAISHRPVPHRCTGADGHQSPAHPGGTSGS